MKTDVVLTMDEYLAQSRTLLNPVSPPASDARHVPITEENEPPSDTELHGCRCDRWGHPCPGCVEHIIQPKPELPISFPIKK